MIGIETDRGPWVSALVAAGYHVYAINPRSASRYRDRHHVGGAKSDAGDARLLADLVRTDRHNHRWRSPAYSDEAGGVRILARAHQQLIWDRVRQTNRLRNAAQGVLPGCTGGLPGACPRRCGGRAVQRARPARGGDGWPRISQIRSALRRGGRQRNLERRAAEVREALRSPQLEAPAAVSKAFAASTGAAMRVLGEINRQIKELEAELATHFEQHPDAGIYRSLPGLGVVLGARVLGEFGDDPERYDSAKFAVTPHVRNRARGGAVVTLVRGTPSGGGSVSPSAANVYLHQACLVVEPAGASRVQMAADGWPRGVRPTWCAYADRLRLASVVRAARTARASTGRPHVGPGRRGAEFRAKGLHRPAPDAPMSGEPSGEVRVVSA